MILRVVGNEFVFLDLEGALEYRDLEKEYGGKSGTVVSYNMFVMNVGGKEGENKVLWMWRRYQEEAISELGELEVEPVSGEEYVVFAGWFVDGTGVGYPEFVFYPIRECVWGEGEWDGEVEWEWKRFGIERECELKKEITKAIQISKYGIGFG